MIDDIFEDNQQEEETKDKSKDERSVVDDVLDEADIGIAIEDSLSKENNRNNIAEPYSNTNNCFEERPLFDCNLLSYLQSKYPNLYFRTRLRSSKQNNCFIFLGTGEYLILTFYEGNSINRKCPLFYLEFHEKLGCNLRLVYDKTSKCSESFILGVVNILQSNFNYTCTIIRDNQYVKEFECKLSVNNWQQAVDEFIKIKSSIDSNIGAILASIGCRALNFMIDDGRFNGYRSFFEAKSVSCCDGSPQKEHNEKNDVEVEEQEEEIALPNDEKPESDCRYPLNTIFYGDIGCGKTFNAIVRAVAIVEDKCHREILKLYKKHEIMQKFNAYQETGQIRFISFHPEFSYEEFVEAVRYGDTEIGDRVIDGVLKEISKKALSSSKKHVFIIDNMEKGDILSIFGETLTAIDEDKRKGREGEIGVFLPYSKTYLYIPENLYIIGTFLNDLISWGNLDKAFVRRFHFEYSDIDSAILKNVKVIDDYGNSANINLYKMVECINKNIREFEDKGVKICPTIFFEYINKNCNCINVEDLNIIFTTKIIPILSQYLPKENIEKVLKVKELPSFQSKGFTVDNFKSIYIDCKDKLLQ